MRINEVVLEKSAEYQRGYDAVDRLLSPTKWNKSNSVTTSSNSVGLDSLDIRDAVSAVVNNKKIYEKERQTLIKLSSEIKSGQRKTYQDSEHLAAILKLAADKPLNDQQRTMLAGFLKEI